MRIYKPILLSIAFFASLAFVADNPAKNLEKSLLWKIEGKNGKTSYLFGTIHLISSDNFFMPAKAEKAFAACDFLMMELDISNQTEMMSMMKYANMADGQTIDKLVSKEDYTLLDSTLQAETGMGMALFNTFKPFIIESMLIQKMIDGDLKSYEAVFAEMSAETEKPIVALETVKQQMELFDDLPYNEQMTDLMKYVKGDEDTKALFKEMVDMYIAEDVSSLYNYMDDYFPDKIWMEKLLFSRNATWVPKIENALQENSLFIAVGAGHLGGDKGLINLLREAGYKVKAVK